MTKKPTIRDIKKVLNKTNTGKREDRIDSFQKISSNTIENPELEKVCSECGEKKSINLFNISESGKRHKAYCKRCEVTINNPKKAPKILKQADPEHKPLIDFKELPIGLKRAVKVYNGEEEKKVSRNIFDTTTNFNEIIKPYIEKNQDGFTVKEILPVFNLPDKSKEYNQVYRILKELVNLKFLRVEKVKGKPNRYFLDDSEAEEIKKEPVFLKNKKKPKKIVKKPKKILEKLQEEYPEMPPREIERCSPGEPIDPLKSLRKERDRLQDYLNDAIKVSNKFENDAVTAVKEVNELRIKLDHKESKIITIERLEKRLALRVEELEKDLNNCKEALNNQVTAKMNMVELKDKEIKELEAKLERIIMTDQGEYGKMTPRPAIDYWKGLAEKYRENCKAYGLTINEERDKNSALRGQLLQFEREHKGRGLGGKLALLLPKILKNIESIGIEPSKEFANTPEFLKVLVACKSTSDMLEVITFLDNDQQKSLENVNKNVIRFEIIQE
jgi:Fe2+ or Zn2+ uptake regulation protein